MIHSGQFVFFSDDRFPELSDYLESTPTTDFLTFLPEKELQHLPGIQDRFRETGKNLYGAVFPELIFQGEFHREGMLLLPLTSSPPALLLEDLSEESTLPRKLESLRDWIDARGRKGMSLFCIFDALIPNIASILNEIYYDSGDEFTYLGANCGSETFQPIPSLFTASDSLVRGALFLLLEGLGEAMMEHGFLRPDRLMAATSAEGNRISTIEWKPAFDRYSEIVQSEYNTTITRENFYNYGVHYPFGIIRGDEPPLIRIPIDLDESRSLFCVGEIPPGSVLTLLQSPPLEPMNAVNRLTERLKPTGGDILLFYCAGRRLHFGEGALQEIKTLNDSISGRSMAGALSLGELGNDRGNGYPIFQNATILAGVLKGSHAD